VYKFWWDEELAILKMATIEANKIWIAVDKPIQGPIFDKRQSSKAKYRIALRNKEKRNANV